MKNECRKTAYDCCCRELADHQDPCLCNCGGSWKYGPDGEFIVVELPAIESAAWILWWAADA